MRIRKKLIFLHTLFSITLTAVLLVALRPAIDGVIEQAERSAAAWVAAEVAEGLLADDDVITREGLTVRVERRPANGDTLKAPGAGVAIDLETGELVVATVQAPDARRARWRVYGLLIGAMLLIYACIAGALEVFVLPKQVYMPIRRMIDADEAIKRGDLTKGVIPESAMPADELGEIMRSRNSAVLSLRHKERQLAEALAELETIAGDLTRKNHLLETAERNLEDADRLASLGMMSAGIAHELNTPLAVVKGLVAKLEGGELRENERALLVRVVGRLEGLGESLVDFARAREPALTPTDVAGVVDEAITLVRIDRGMSGFEIVNDLAPGCVLPIDADRMVQVFVNLIRNAVDVLIESGTLEPVVRVHAFDAEAPGVDTPVAEVGEPGGWVGVVVEDNGPGIEVGLLASLFEPFVTKRLDDRGTGLGLAVAQGIVREHGGVLIARNRLVDGEVGGAVFEVTLPRRGGVVGSEA